MGPIDARTEPDPANMHFINLVRTSLARRDGVNVVCYAYTLAERAEMTHGKEIADAVRVAVADGLERLGLPEYGRLLRESRHLFNY